MNDTDKAAKLLGGEPVELDDGVYAKALPPASPDGPTMVRVRDSVHYSDIPIALEAFRLHPEQAVALLRSDFAAVKRHLSRQPLA